MLPDDGNGRASAAGEVLVAALARSHASYYVLALPRAVLGGERLTSFLAQVAPFGSTAAPRR